MTDETLDKMAGNPMQDLVDVMPADTPITPAVGVAAMALGFAIKYHGATVIKDGVMYQQYKMEGRNIRPLMIDEVFGTAKRIEEYLIFSQHRIAGHIISAIRASEEADAERAAREE